MRRLPLALAVAAALTLMIPAVATATSSPGATTAAGDVQTPQGAVHLSVNIHRFYATKSGKTKANGTVKATVTPIGQKPTTVTKNVTLTDTPSENCTILTLTLEKLELNLLGLEVHLEKLVLTVTGEPHGGALGALFCSLAKGTGSAGKGPGPGGKGPGPAGKAHKASLGRLNAAVKHHAVRAVGFSAAVSQATTPTAEGICPVLNLVLGPLHLDLLGLVVDLNQVHLTIDANPNGGVLGSLFCNLANTKLE